MKLSSILERKKRLDREASYILREVMKCYGLDAGYVIPQRPNEKMPILQEEELEEAALAERLTEYASWIAYFDAKCTRWAAIYDYLCNLYRGCLDETFVKSQKGPSRPGTGNSIQDREARAKTEYLALDRASQMAKERLTKAKSDLLQASTQHKLVSRIITLKQYEAQGIPERKHFRRNDDDE